MTFWIKNPASTFKSKGVAQVNLIGGQEREIKVNLDKNKLEGYGLSIPQVQQAILTSNVDFPTGNVKPVRAVRSSDYPENIKT